MRMGLTPRQIDQLSFAELRCVQDGFNTAHGGETKAAPPSPEQHRERLARTRNR